MSGLVILVTEEHTHTHKKISRNRKNTKLVMQPAGQDVKVIVWRHFCLLWCFLHVSLKAMLCSRMMPRGNKKYRDYCEPGWKQREFFENYLKWQNNFPLISKGTKQNITLNYRWNKTTEKNDIQKREWRDEFRENALPVRHISTNQMKAELNDTMKFWWK